MLARHGLAEFFALRVFRDDYDPESEGHPKDIRYCDGHVLVDDDSRNTEYVASTGGIGLTVRSYALDEAETWRADCDEIYQRLKRCTEGPTSRR